MGEIFQEENAIILAAAEKMVALGSEAAQRMINGKQATDQEETGEKILRLLTAYRRKDNLTDAQLESILYCLRQASGESVFPTIDPIVGQDLVYLTEQEAGVSSTAMQIQNSGSNLALRDTLNFQSGLIAVDDGTKINISVNMTIDGLSDVTITTPVSGEGLKYNGSIWVNSIVEHTIKNSGTPLTARANLNFSNGLTASDNTPDTDVKWGGLLTGVTTITSNVANQLNFTGTWTATANNSFMAQFGGTLTSRNTASDNLYGYLINPTLTRNGGNPATQTAYGLYINPTFTNTFANEYALGVNGKSIFTAEALLSNALLKLTGSSSAIYITGGHDGDYVIYTDRSLSASAGVGHNLGDFTNFVGSSGSSYASLRLGVQFSGSQSHNHYSGLDVGFVHTTSGTTDWEYGVYHTVSANGGGTLTQSAAFYAANASVSGATIGTQYALFSENLTSATINWGVYLNGQMLNYFGGGVLIGTTTNNARLYVVQSALAASWIPALRVDPGAHTFMTASTEYFDNYFKGSTKTWASAGSAWNQRYTYFEGSVTTTGVPDNVYTVYVDPPTGTGTNKWALGLGGHLAINTANGKVAIGSVGIISEDAVGLRIGGLAGGSGFSTKIVDNSNTQVIGWFYGGELYVGLNPVSTNASFYFAQQAYAASWKPSLRVDPGAHTSMTASTEYFDNYFKGSTKTWASAGSAWNQRYTYFEGSVTTTGVPDNVYTVYVDPPTGTGTNKWALGTNGNVQLGGTITQLGATTDGGSTRTIQVGGGSSEIDLILKNKGSTGTFTFEATSGSAVLKPAGSASAFVLYGTGTTPVVILGASSSNTGLYIQSVTASSGDIEMYPSAINSFFISIKGSAPASATGGAVSLLGGSPTGGNNIGGNATIGSGVPSGSGADGSVYLQNRASGKIGFFNVTPVVRQAGLTAITHTAPGTPDYAIQDLVAATGFGFATKDEGNTLLSVVKAMHDAMKNYGLLT